jgi:phosphatidate cytidylyltransferase
MDFRTLALAGAVVAILGAATLAVHYLRRQPETGINPALVGMFHLRIRAWWLMCSALAAALLLHPAATVVLFGLISFWALREFITLTPTRLGDHRALFWVFFLITPLQYVLVALDEYGLYSVLIPVYAFLFIPARVAFAGDYKRFLERTAKMQAALMICVYCLSYAPAMLSIKLYNAAHEEVEGRNPGLLFFFVLMVQMGDVLQYGFGKLWGHRVIAPSISPNRTWEGMFLGIGSATLLGAALSWATPFDPLQAAGLTLVITFTGFAGGMTMSAIKRDRDVKDYGTLVEGHGGVLDRIDSICFAAPIFYHVTKWLSEQGWLIVGG